MTAPAPFSWAGTVLLGDAALVTAPADEVAHGVRRVLEGVPAGSLTEPAVVGRVLPVAEVLGLATLACLSAAGFRPYGRPGATIENLPVCLSGGHARKPRAGWRGRSAFASWAAG